MKWLFSRMGSDVPFQVIRVREPFFAFLTSKWLFPRMGSEVPLPVTMVRKPYSAYVTTKWLFSRMGSDVPVQATTGREPFVAYLTSKWSFWSIALCIVWGNALFLCYGVEVSAEVTALGLIWRVLIV